MSVNCNIDIKNNFNDKKLAVMKQTYEQRSWSRGGRSIKKAQPVLLVLWSIDVTLSAHVALPSGRLIVTVTDTVTVNATVAATVTVIVFDTVTIAVAATVTVTVTIAVSVTVAFTVTVKECQKCHCHCRCHGRCHCHCVLHRATKQSTAVSSPYAVTWR